MASQLHSGSRSVQMHHKERLCHEHHMRRSSLLCYHSMMKEKNAEPWFRASESYFFRLCAHFGAVFLTDGKVSNIPLVNVIRIYTQKLEENPAQNCIIPLYNSHDSLISRPMTLQRWNLKHQSRDSIINPCASKNVAHIAGVYTRTWLICLHHALCKCQSSNTEQGEEDKKKVKKELCPVCSAVEACQRFSPTGSSVILSSPCSLKHSGMVRD